VIAARADYGIYTVGNHSRLALTSVQCPNALSRCASPVTALQQSISAANSEVVTRSEISNKALVRAIGVNQIQNKDNLNCRSLIFGKPKEQEGPRAAGQTTSVKIKRG
jgi:hypothetical protein